jgi:hypothetical protein
MKKTKIVYLGTARGQAESVFIGKLRFERGEVYELDAELAERLLATGGFDVVTPPRAKKLAPVESEEVLED